MLFLTLRGRYARPDAILEKGFRHLQVKGYAFAQGLIVQVDSHQNVRITRVDGYNQATLETVWDVHTGDLTKYTEQRQTTATNCSFDANDHLKLRIDGSSLSASFDAASSAEAGPAQYYQVELLVPDARGQYQVIQHAEMSSQQVFYPHDVGISDCHYQHLFTEVGNLADFALVVTAWDCWDVSENALVYTNGRFVYVGQADGSVSCETK